PADIIADLQENYADISGSYIPLDDWLTETGSYLRQVYTALIPEPTDVDALCDEQIEQAALAVWSDERAQKIRLQVLRQIATDAAAYDDSVIMEGSLRWQEQPEKRVSQVWVYFGLIDPLGDIEDPSNYRSCEVVIDQDAEADAGVAIKKIFSR